MAKSKGLYKFDAKKFLNDTEKAQAIEEYLVRKPSIVKNAVHEALQEDIKTQVSNMLCGYTRKGEDTETRKRVKAYQEQIFKRMENELAKQIDKTYTKNPEIFEEKLREITEQEIKRHIKDQWYLNRYAGEAFKELLEAKIKEGIKDYLENNQEELMAGLVDNAVKDYVRRKF